VGLSRTVVLLLATAVASAGQAEEDKTKLLAETVTELRQAIAADNYVMVHNLCGQLEQLQPSFIAKEFNKAVQTVALGLKHKDVSIAIVTVKTLGKLRHPGSSKYLSTLLAVPRKVPAERWPLHLAAIDAAAAIHEFDSAPRLEKILNHAKSDFAVAAAKAFASYAQNDRAERVKLIDRLANTLGRLERKKSSKPPEQIRLAVVKQTLLDSMRVVSGNPDFLGAGDARAWVREQKKQLKAEKKKK